MGTLSLTDPVNGTTADASVIANNNAATKTVVNGGIDNTNLAAGAAIAISKIADPGSGKVVTSAGAGSVADFPPGHEYAYVEFTGNVSITNTTESTSNTVVTSTSVAFDGATTVFIEFFSPLVEVSGTDIGSKPVLFDGSSSIGWLAQQKGADASGGGETAMLVKRRVTPSNASHTYSVRSYLTGSGTVTYFGGAGGAGAFVPGYIRITKA